MPLIPAAVIWPPAPLNRHDAATIETNLKSLGAPQ